MDRLAPVGHNETTPRGALEAQAEEAAQWIRAVRTDGHMWSPLPEPTVSELRPNAKGEHGAWASVVREIVAEGKDLTRLWWVSATRRDEANDAGLTSWADPAVTPAALGITGDTTAPTLQALLDVNRGVGPDVQPARVESRRDDWYVPDAVEFFVDYETVGDLDDDFSHMPQRGGQEMIFMIGCGHMENGEWQFECFVADSLTGESETAVIETWFKHMAAVTDRLGGGEAPKVFHWSVHERSSLQSAISRAGTRHPDVAVGWRDPNWFDFMTAVVKAEPSFSAALTASASRRLPMHYTTSATQTSRGRRVRQTA